VRRVMTRAGIASGAEPVPGPAREFPYTVGDFRRIADILRNETGIALTEVKAPLVYSRLVKRLRELGLQSFESYCALISQADEVEERRVMSAALTTNITRFFREPHHFEHLRTVVLPPLIDLALSGGRVRLWSAGCSSGEEPYSIALTLLSLLPDAEHYDIKILAVDIDPNVLALGRAGLYSARAMADVDPAMRATWFSRAPQGETEMWSVAPPLRDLVTFRELNLIAPWPMRGAFQAIFCRNTVIYFDQEVQRQVWRDMAAVCAPGGHLYVGHSERMAGTDLFELAGLTIYRRAEDR
jgi:chemotaxis protein methyltransferase CheR